MPTIFIAEDSRTQGELIRVMLRQRGWQAELFPDGEEALKAVAASPPDLILTDLDMPRMDGLELVSAVRQRFPKLPVVLMTAFGSEETAMRALHAGAASYVPKRELQRELLDTIEAVLELSRGGASQSKLNQCVASTASEFALANDPELIPAIVAHLQDMALTTGLADDCSAMRLGMAWDLAIRHAMIQGNLELDEGVAQASRADQGEAILRIAERRGAAPYADRVVKIGARATREAFEVSVQHQGPAGATASLQFSPGDSFAEGEAHHSGVLIRSFIDDVEIDAAGTSIRMTVRRES